MTVWASTQKAHDLFQALTSLLDFDESRLRVATPDVGGGFGPKLCVYPEDIAVVAAAKLIGRSIKWVEDRREHFTNAAQERDQYWSVDIAVDAGGKLLGVRGRLIHELGAYALQDVNIPYNSASMMSGPYVLPALAMEVDRRRHQQDPGVVGARRRLSAGRLRDGAADGPRGARIEIGARRAAAAQPDPAREDALHQAAQGALRRRHAIRQRRLSGLPGEGAQGGGLGRLPAAAGGGARARPPYRHRARARHQGHRPRAVRVRAGAGVEHRAGVGVHRRRRDRAGARHRAGADLRRRARPARAGHHGGAGRYRRHRARARRLRQPPDRHRRLVRAARRARRRRQGQEARQPRAGSGRARPRDRRRRGARGRRTAALGQARRARAHPQGGARLRLPARRRARPRRRRQLAHRRARLCQCLPRRRGRGRHRHRRRQASSTTWRCRTPAS